MRSAPLFVSFAVVALSACGGGATSPPTTQTGSSGARPGPVIQVIQKNVPSAFEEFRIPTRGSGPAGIVATAAGISYFSEYNGNKIGRVSNSGGITEPIVLAAGSAPQGITIDKATGDVWFTERGASKIGHWHAGALSEYPTTTPNSGPYGITKGPDGNMWFTEYNSSKVGKVSTSGTGMAEYSTGSSAAFPTTIIAAPDGALWFAESGFSSLGRISTKGSAMTVALGVNAKPQDLAVASDGNIWYTSPSTNAVGSISLKGVSGVLSTISGASPFGITKGPDGNPWFTEPGTNAIQSITVGATPSLGASYPITTAASNPYAVVTGSDGNLWFTEQNTNNIGVYLYHHQTATPSSIGFTALGQTQSFTVNETNYSGTFWASSSNTGIATASPASGATSFTVTAVAPGKATITVSDSSKFPQSGNGVKITVTVTTTSITVN